MLVSCHRLTACPALSLQTSAGLNYSFSVFSPALKELFGLNEVQLGAVATLGFNLGGTEPPSTLGDGCTCPCPVCDLLGCAQVTWPSSLVQCMMHWATGIIWVRGRSHSLVQYYSSLDVSRGRISHSPMQA